MLYTRLSNYMTTFQTAFLDSLPSKIVINRDCPLDENIRKNLFVVMLSKVEGLMANGNLANGQSVINVNIPGIHASKSILWKAI